MSLETLAEAARYVEQQDQLAQLRATASAVSPARATPLPTPALQPAAVAFDHAAQPHAALPVQPKHVTDIPVLNINPNKFLSSPTTVIETNGFSKPVQAFLSGDENSHGSFSVSEKKSSRTPVPGGGLRSGTREVHNKLEKNRRAHLKECFELLKRQLPQTQDEKKSSNLSILHSALRYIQMLKKKERENEHEMERLAREKISAQQRLASLKKELGVQWENLDFNNLISEASLKDDRGVADRTVRPCTTNQNGVRQESTQLNGEETRVATTTALQPAQLSMHLPLQQVVSQGLVLGLHKVAIVPKTLVSSPVTHIITAPPQLNGKVVPLMNAQYLMKPVVVVSTSSASSALPPPPS